MNRFATPVTSFERYSRYIDVHKSSFLYGEVSFSPATGENIHLKIGERCIIKGNFSFQSSDASIIIGDNVHLADVNLICRSGIEIESDVTMAWGITLYDHNSHSVSWEDRKNDNTTCYNDYINYNNNIVNKDWSMVKTGSIKICSKVWVGFDAVILKGVTVGEGAVIGARSVVTRDVDPWTVVAGNPAKVVKKLK